MQTCTRRCTRAKTDAPTRLIARSALSKQRPRAKLGRQVLDGVLGTDTPQAANISHGPAKSSSSAPSKTAMAIRILWRLWPPRPPASITLARRPSSSVSRASGAGRILSLSGTYSPAGVEPAKSGCNPALSRNCDAPEGGRARSPVLLRRTSALDGRAGSCGDTAGPPPPTRGGADGFSGRSTRSERRERLVSSVPSSSTSASFSSRGSEVLFGLRRGAHGGGTWSFPGGHVDA